MTNTIYLECTHTYNSGLHTGIQRVVKNIVSNIEQVQAELNLEVIPIILQNDHYVKFSKFPVVNKKKNIIKVILKKTYIAFRSFFSYILPYRISKFFYSPNVNVFLSTFIDKILFSKVINISHAIELKSNDILILMDAIWLHNNYKNLANLKRDNIKLVALVYDIIPLTHPQFCTIDLTLFLQDWYKNATQYIDGYIAISKSVQDQIFEYIKENIDSNISYSKFDYFYLGTNFLESKKSKIISKNFQKIFENKDVFLTVSTIEPRKNHQFIIDAFDIVWNKNIDVKCVLIGKVGWNVKSLIDRIKSHTEYNKRLFVLTEVDDEELQYAYRHSKAFIFASYIEGFGLPIIESLFYKLPVLASNIEVHKEIGRDNIIYFDLKKPSDLAALILDNSFINIENFIWQDWKESTKEFIIKSRDVLEK